MDETRMTEEAWDDVLRINLKSIFNMTKAIQRPMLKQRSGSIINMSSVVGVEGNAGQSNYAASKSGIIGFSKSIAQEIGSRNIRCNVIAPGFIETEMTAELDEKVKEGWMNDIPLKRKGAQCAPKVRGKNRHGEQWAPTARFADDMSARWSVAASNVHTQ